MIFFTRNIVALKSYNIHCIIKDFNVNLHILVSIMVGGSKQLVGCPRNRDGLCSKGKVFVMMLSPYGGNHKYDLVSDNTFKLL